MLVTTKSTPSSLKVRSLLRDEVYGPAPPQAGIGVAGLPGGELCQNDWFALGICVPLSNEEGERSNLEGMIAARGANRSHVSCIHWCGAAYE